MDDDNEEPRFAIRALSEEYDYEDENEEEPFDVEESRSMMIRPPLPPVRPASVATRPRSSLLENIDEIEIKPTTSDMILGFRPPKNLVDVGGGNTTSLQHTSRKALFHILNYLLFYFNFTIR